MSQASLGNANHVWRPQDKVWARQAEREKKKAAP
jgi:hypothetical protein